MYCVKKREPLKCVILTLRKKAVFLQIHICKSTVLVYNTKFPHLNVKEQFFMMYICRNTVLQTTGWV